MIIRRKGHIVYFKDLPNFSEFLYTQREKPRIFHTFQNEHI